MKQRNIFSKTYFLFIALLLLVFTSRSLPLLAQHGQLAAMRNTVEGGYNFWHYAPPEYTVDHRRVPVIIFLHGASLCGNNLDRVHRYGLLDAIRRGRYYPCMVIAPQNPGGSWNPHKRAKVLDWVEANYEVDTTCVYVIGMSLGGYGTLDFAGTYPNRVAAAMALCGGSTLSDYSGLGKVPLWILHGTADRAVSVNESKKVVKAIQQSGHDKLLRFDWLAGATHGDLARILYLKQTFDWIFAHSLADEPRTVDRNVPVTLKDLRNAYDGIDPEATKFDIVKRVHQE